MYVFPDADRFRDSDLFASVDGMPSLMSIAPQDYYTRQLAINEPDRVLEIPANLETQLDRFFSSSADDQDRFLRACFWFDHAHTVSRHSQSATFCACPLGWHKQLRHSWKAQNVADCECRETV